MHNLRKFLPKILLICVLLIVFGGSSVLLAQENTWMGITSIDSSEFPTVQLNLIASDGTGQRLTDLTGLEISEDNLAISDYTIEEVPVGIELTFVIDANVNIQARDDETNLTRLEKVRDNIITFAQQYMDDTQLDRVSIVVPGDASGTIVLDDSPFPNAVINEINFYEPSLPNTTPLNEMMTLALENAGENHEEGRYQAIILFSDAGQIDQQLDTAAVVTRAQELNLSIFGVILGALADANEIANMTALTDPTRGTYVHMGELGVAEPIYAQIQGQRAQYQIQYQSQANTSGDHIVTTSLNGATANSQFELELAPPATSLAIDNSQPIRRVLPSPEAALSAAEPTVQPIAALIEWPDGHPRSIASASLVINSVPQPPVPDPQIGADNIIMLEWDISNLDEGSYTLSVHLTDALGLESQSDPLPMELIVEGRAVAPEEPEVQPTAVPEEEPAIEPESLLQNLGVVGIILGVLALIVALAVLIFAISVVRRRRPAAVSETTSQPAPAEAQQDVEHDATQVLMPAFAANLSAIAYLEPLENAGDQSDNMPITSANMAIGRDPKLADIRFAHKSVSRLHARIIEKNGIFQLYDEGSASGTYINYEQISLQPQRLNDNDDIHFGQVHVRFHVTAGVDDSDSTQVMPSPMAPGRPSRQEPGVDDDMSTQPYMPNQPPSPGGGYQPPPPADDDDDDEDDLSTQPYMPHAPR